MDINSLIMNKICKNCNISQPLENYYKSPTMRYGRINICKQCKSIYAKKYNLENKIKVKEKTKKYKQRNIEEVRRKAREYRFRNKEKYKLNLHLWQKNNPEKVRN